MIGWIVEGQQIAAPESPGALLLGDAIGDSGFVYCQRG